MQKNSQLTIKDQTTEFLLYTTPSGDIKVEVLQDRMAKLFGVQRPAITKHLKKIFIEGELNENMVSSILEHTTSHGAIEGKTQIQKVKYYNLDAIIAVGLLILLIKSI